MGSVRASSEREPRASLCAASAAGQWRGASCLYVRDERVRSCVLEFPVRRSTKGNLRLTRARLHVHDKLVLVPHMQVADDLREAEREGLPQLHVAQRFHSAHAVTLTTVER
jgi:hypothetical protein